MSADRLVFPGVGAFGAAMQVLNQNGCLSLSLYLHSHAPFHFIFSIPQGKMKQNEQSFNIDVDYCT